MMLALIQGQSHRFPGEGITWAGESPNTQSFCFGTENGKLLFYKSVDAQAIEVLGFKVAEDAINDVAFWRDYIGISTRNEVLIQSIHPSDDLLEKKFASLDGAHGILATPAGHFIAPMGELGLLCIEVGADQKVTATKVANAQSGPYFYKLAYLTEAEGEEILACAAGTDGLLGIQLGKNEAKILHLHSPHLDLVDVCSLRSPTRPLAVVGLSLDNSLIFVRDFRDEKEQPKAMRLEGFRGTPYTIMSTGEHLFVLTSEEIIAFPDMISKYLASDHLDSPTQYRYTAVQAVDAYIAYGRYLMIVLEDEVRVFEIPAIVHPALQQGALSATPGSMPWSGNERNLPMIARQWERRGSLDLCSVEPHQDQSALILG